MGTITNEYGWHTGEASHTAAYLWPVLEKQLRRTPPGGKVLDAGCGNGATLRLLEGRGFQLYGMEISSSGVERAKSNCPNARVEQIDLAGEHQDHALKGQMDLVYSLEVVEHVFLPRLYARNLHNLLKPGGLAVISTPYHGYVKNVALAVANKMDFHFTALWDFGHIKFWSRRTLTLLLEEAGFEVIGFEGAGRIPYLWKSMVLIARKPT